MKKIIALACMITCILGLTACGSEVNYTEYEQEKLDDAKQIAVEQIVPYLQNFMDDANVDKFAENTPDEITFLVAQETGLTVDGNAMLTAVSSFNSTADAIGNIVSLGEATAEIDDKMIIVTVPVEGSVKNAEAEVILSNDLFMIMESAALNEESSLGDSMTKAALNTLIGMGTVFVVLIIIICVISLFAFIPKIQALFSKKEKEEKKAEPVKAAPAPAPAPVVAESVDVSNDCELVAVIAAAIAASEGQTSTEGFVVRSIRKVNRRK